MNIKMDELPPKVSAVLTKAGLVSCKTILETQECDLLNLGQITPSDIEQIYKLAARGVIEPSRFISGSEIETKLSSRWRCLSTGCTRLDSLLRGGVQTRGITELSGQSGCGKTQLCLQLALTVQLPTSAGGLAAGAAFLCTEDRFPSIRLNQLITSCPAALNFKDIQYGNNVFVEHISDVAELQKCVEERLPQLVRQHRLGLVVVDSVAAVFRTDYTPAESVQRAKDMRAFAARLHHLASTLHVAVVCINQVSDVQRGESTQTVPALGLAWANLVTCRLQMTRTNDVRQLHVVFAPHLPRAFCYYNITAAGVVGVGQPTLI